MADDVATADPSSTPTEELDKLVIRFAGDSGDGMQLGRFDVSPTPRLCSATTWPPSPVSLPRFALPPERFPECRASRCRSPTSTSSPPAMLPDCLVAMNPAALMKNLKDLRQGGTLIVNTDTFEERNLTKAGYEIQPAGGRFAQRLPGHQGPDGRTHQGGGQGQRS